MSQPTWAEVQAGVQAAIAVAGGLATIWRDQDANQPEADYVGLSLGRVATVDVDWVDERYDPQLDQVVLTNAGTREVMLQIEVWSSSTVEKVAKATARATCDKIVSRLRLPRARNALRAVGVTPFDPGPTNWVPSVVSANFRGRASCDVRCRMPARAFQEFTDWIACIAGYAEIRDMPDGQDVTVGFGSCPPEAFMYWGTAPQPGGIDEAFVKSLLNSAGVAARQRSIRWVQPTQTYNGAGEPQGEQIYAWIALPAALDGDSSNYIDHDEPHYEVGFNLQQILTIDGVLYHVRFTDNANLGVWTLDIT